MADTESTQLTKEIINKALEGRAQQFIQIQDWNEFTYYRRLSLSTKIIIRTLRQSANGLFKDYCRDVIDGISDVTKLLAYSQILDVVVFYENELTTIKKMLDDYDDYLGNFGNFVRALCGERRES